MRWPSATVTSPDDDNDEETPAMAKWTAFPYDKFDYDSASVKKHWARLHAGDAEPLPKDAKVLDAWALFHNGEFHKAYEAGLKAGGAGITVANKAQAIYANYLEKSEKTKLAMFMEVAERAEAQAAEDAKNANAHYWMAYALGRYSQGISVAKALAQGLGGKVKGALETAIKLAPKHADAHIALGAFHAEVIDKVGALLGKTQGASKATGLAMYQRALELNPKSAIAMVEYANGLVMLEGDRKMAEAEKLYADAAACEPMDAMERLDVEMAKAELDE
jgi:tetratricopeptide (TPR) repeat protein